MTAIVEVRASDLPLAFRCPGSARSPAVRIDEEAQGGAVGTAAHEVLRSLAETGQIEWSAIATAAARHDVPAVEVSILCALATKLWPAIKDSFRDATTEVFLSSDITPALRLTGHADLLAFAGTAARVGDWKTGRKDHDYSQQMRAYAALALLEDPALTEATATVIWVRDAEIENYTMTRDGVQPWIKEVVERVGMWDGTFFPGQHCNHCPRSHECQARHALARRDVAAIADHALVERAESALAEMTPDEIVSLFEKAELVTKYATRVKNAIRYHMIETGQDIVGAGNRLTLARESTRKLDPLKAWPVIEGLGLPDEKLAECLDVSISALERVVAKRAGRGSGAAAVRDLAAALEKADAVHKTERIYVKEKRT